MGIERGEPPPERGATIGTMVLRLHLHRGRPRSDAVVLTSAHWGFTSNSVACQCNGGSPDVDICQVGTIGPGSTDNVDTCLPIGTSMTTFADYCNAYPGGSCSCCCPP